MSDLNRRDAIKLLAVIAAAPSFSFGCSRQEMEQAQEHAAAAETQPGTDYELQFFSEHEYRTVSELADLVIPADERSGSATDAHVPEFMDFIMVDELLPGMDERQSAMRGGLAWLDYYCLEEFEELFVECSTEEQHAVLDAIAYPEEADPELSHGVAFFNSFRDLTASGFFSSRAGYEDLQYAGNQMLAEWNGCPVEALEHIGVGESA